MSLFSEGAARAWEPTFSHARLGQVFGARSIAVVGASVVGGVDGSGDATAVTGAGAAVNVAAVASTGGGDRSVIDGATVSRGGSCVAVPPLLHAATARPRATANPARRDRE